MINDNKLPWILCGYELFAKEGPKGLKIEVIARQVNKNKSSFYHYFADIEIFTEALLKYHLDRATIIAEKERQCKNIVPELLHVLLEIKQDLLFNKQLRVHRHIIAYKDCLEKSGKKVAEAITDIWAEALGLTDNSHLANMVLNLSLENFYLQLTEETLTFEWLENYIKDLQAMVKEFERKNTLIDGSV